MLVKGAPNAAVQRRRAAVRSATHVHNEMTHVRRARNAGVTVLFDCSLGGWHNPLGIAVYLSQSDVRLASFAEAM